MNNPDHPASADRQEFISAMFASLVMQHTNMATIFLGLTPHPQTGQVAPDLEHARYFIDQLEMIEAKTKGNLNKQEADLLNQSLTSLRLAFVEAVSKPPVVSATDEQGAPPSTAVPPTEPATPIAPDAAAAAEESRKKFTKKY